MEEDAETYYEIGYIKKMQGHLEEAATAFRRAIQLNTSFVKAYEAMGNTCQKMGRLKESENYFEMAGDQYLQKEMLDEAEEVFMDAYRLNPENLNIHNSLGIVYRRKGLYDKAIKAYQKGIKVSPKDEHIHFNLGRVFMEKKEIAQAKASFEVALNIAPGFTEALKMLRMIAGKSKG